MAGLRRAFTLVTIVAAVFASSASADSLFENFDTLTPPANPVNWSTGSDGGQIWASQASSPFSAPNSLFTPDASPNSCAFNHGGYESIATTDVTVGAAPRIAFANSYNLENRRDGGVLTISINGANPQDVTAAGGTFVSGGYNDTLNNGSFNSYAGQSAWTGDSGGYRQTIVSFPNIAAGTLVRVTFLMALDCSGVVAGGAWRIDDVAVGRSATATTGVATGDSTDSVGLSGTLTNHDFAGSYHFEYGPTTTYGAQTTTRALPPAAADTPVTENLSGLEPGTTYHYRLVATTPVGTTNGGDMTFTTQASAPPPLADVTPPDTTIDKVKLKSEKGRASFKFSANEPGSTFECKFDRKPFAACASPQGYKRLDDGRHKFRVRAIDAAGNVDLSPAKNKFKVNLDG